MSVDPLAVVITLVIALAAILPFWVSQRRHERRAAAAEAHAARHGLNEPVTIHPVVTAELCIGIGNCVSVCPEGDVLGLRNGQARPIAPAKCIGHGACERVCPVNAITLVFGTEKRGVELPRIKENFETNVPGLYVIGELGGMGLIRNAFEQGRQCIEGIKRERTATRGDELDVLIVGCGPAGLSASLNCQRLGLKFRTIEREEIGGTVRHYPRKKLVMTSPVKIPGYGKLSVREIAKEQLIDLWEDVVKKTGLVVNTGETVEAITPTGQSFTVQTTRGMYRARRVVLAIGRRGVPRKLEIPGEDLSKVAYSLREPEAYRNEWVTVVGGGDSAVEAALALAEQPGNRVALSYRGDRFSRIKDGNRSRIEAAAKAGIVDILWSTNLTEITPNEILYSDSGSGMARLQNSALFIFAGGVLPTKFLQACGVVVDMKQGESLGAPSGP